MTTTKKGTAATMPSATTTPSTSTSMPNATAEPVVISMPPTTTTAPPTATAPSTTSTTTPPTTAAPSTTGTTTPPTTTPTSSSTTASSTTTTAKRSIPPPFVSLVLFALAYWAFVGALGRCDIPFCWPLLILPIIYEYALAFTTVYIHRSLMTDPASSTAMFTAAVLPQVLCVALLIFLSFALNYCQFLFFVMGSSYVGVALEVYTKALTGWMAAMS